MELYMLERHQPWNMTHFIPQHFHNLHHDHNNRNTNTSYWSHNKQDSSRSFTIGPILNEIDPPKQFLIL